MDTQCGKRKIFVLHFALYGEEPFTITNKYCKSANPIYYDIVYLRVTSDNLKDKNFFSILDTMNKACDVLLLYANTSSNYAREIVSDFLIAYKHFGNAIYYNEGFNTFDDSFLKTNDITGLKIYNISSRFFSSYHWKVKRVDDANVLFIPSENYYYEPSLQNNLECQPWFQHYIYKAFDCTTGRLYQYSGTCYLNAVINGLLLSPGLRELLKHVYNKDENRVETFVSLSDLACPLPQTKSSKGYILNLVHNILCRKEKLLFTGEELDVMKEASKSLFSSKFDMSSPDYGEGGQPIGTIQLVLRALNIHYLIRRPQSMLYPDEKYANYEAISREMDFYPADLAKRQFDNPDILIDWHFLYANERNKKYRQDMTPEQEKSFEGVDYALQFGIILIQFVDENERKNNSHAVLGMFCHGKPQIYDSNNLFLDVDWTKLNIDKTIEEGVKEYFSKVYKNTAKTVGIQFSVYMRKELNDFLLHNPVQCNL